MEVSHRPKQGNHFLGGGEIHSGNSGFCKDLSDSRGMGLLNRHFRSTFTSPSTQAQESSCGSLTSLKFISLPLCLRINHTSLHNNHQKSEAYGPLQGDETPPVPGQLAHHGTISERGTSEYKDHCTANRVFGVHHQPRKVRVVTDAGVLVGGLRTTPRLSPCKTHSGQMTKTTGFDPQNKVKVCFYCKMFDVANWVASINRRNGPGGSPSHETLSVARQGELEISSVTGQPPSMVRDHVSSPGLVAESAQPTARLRH